jgi:AraC family transcriptional regulator of adaptative response/methylated-DNA-[protein]-cysteine methyltransferase
MTPPPGTSERDEASKSCGQAEGLMFSADTASGVFCRPGCPDTEPQAKPDTAGARVYENARDALAAGFKPCRKCRPLNAGDADPDWLENLMSAVEADPARRWHDLDLRGMDMDPAAVRRWFIKHHGMTFHAYARLRRLGQALMQMQHGATVSEAVHGQGYPSESDYREAFTQVFGNPPTAVDREGSIWINRVATPLGSMVMGVSDQGLCLLEFAERRMLDTQLKRLREKLGRVFLPGDHPLMPSVKSQLDGYFEGSLQAFTIPLQISGTGFQEAVWHALLQIPYGEMRSYSGIAQTIGQAEAVRAVGRANGDNRIAIIVPCHRVVGAGGELTGYGGGLWRKEYLLSLEQSQSFHLS